MRRLTGFSACVGVFIFSTRCKTANPNLSRDYRIFPTYTFFSAVCSQDICRDYMIIACLQQAFLAFQLCVLWRWNKRKLLTVIDLHQVQTKAVNSAAMLRKTKKRTKNWIYCSNNVISFPHPSQCGHVNFVGVTLMEWSFDPLTCCHEVFVVRQQTDLDFSGGMRVFVKWIWNRAIL